MNTVEGPHDLTPLQRKYLRNIWEYCRTPPTLARIYQKTAPAYLFLVTIMALLAYLFVALERLEGAWLAGGMILGMLFRDFGMFQRAIQLWPATEAVIDREKLAELLQEHPEDSDPDDWS